MWIPSGSIQPGLHELSTKCWCSQDRERKGKLGLKQLRRTTKSCDCLFPIPRGSQETPITGRGFYTRQAKRTHIQVESHERIHSQAGDKVLHLCWSFISPRSPGVFALHIPKPLTFQLNGTGQVFIPRVPLPMGELLFRILCH